MSTPREHAIEARHAEHRAICERVEPWTYGTHVRAPRYPTYYDFNCLRVEHGEPAAGELLAEAERLLGDLDHRKIEVEDTALGERLRPEFIAAGWDTSRVATLIIEGEPDAPPAELEEVAHADVLDLRAEWSDDPPEVFDAFAPMQDEIAERMGCRTFVARRDGRPVAFVLFNAIDVWQVYTTPAARGQGLGRALVGAAVRAAYADGAERVLIAADDEGTPKALYLRIGFRPAWTWWEFTRKPTAASP